MSKNKPTYEELEQRVREFEKVDAERQRENETTLSESEQLYRGLFDQASEGLFLMTLDGQLFKVNKAFADMHGYTLDEIRNMNIQELDVLKEGALKERAAIINRIQAGETVRFEVEHYHKNGYIFPLSVTTSLVAIGGRNYVLASHQDISERKQAEEELRKEKEFTEIALNSQLDTFYLFEPATGKALRWNTAFKDITGYSDEEIGTMAASAESFFSPEDLERASNFNLDVLEKGTGTIELDLICKDGRTVPTEYKVSVIRDESGTPKYFVSLGRDITERKRAAVELEKSNQLMKTLLDNLQIGVFMIDPAGKPLLANNRAVELLGRGIVSEAAKDTLAEVYEAFKDGTDQLYPSEQMPIVRGLQGESTYIDDMVIVHPDATNIYLEVYGTPVKDGEGNITASLACFADIGERRRAAQALQKSETELSNALRFGNLGHWEYDVAEDMFTFSDEFYSIFRTTAEQVGGYTMSSSRYAERFVHPDDQPLVAIETRKALEASDDTYSRTLEHRMVYTDGEIGHIAVHFQIVKDSNNRTVKLYGVNQDITERKQLEEERNKASKLESIGFLAGGIAHDFNNILSVILSNVSLANMDVQDENSRVSESLSAAETACIRARDLTQQLLTFSKGGEPVKKTTSLAGLLEETAGFALRGSNVRCLQHIPPDLWPCEVDEGQISQVINNLLINADQAMPEGGTISLHAENVTVGKPGSLPLDDGKYVKLTIADQGLGISEEHLSKVFDPYFSTKQKGSGLGLATTYSIIKRHGGHITVESELKIGTTFLIYLPASGKQVEEKEGEEKKNVAIRCKILVMDDEPEIRDVVSRMLEQLGHEVECASHGAKALDMYKNAKDSGQPFDTVILDLTIPGGMGGQKTIQMLHEIDSHVQAIVSSGYSNDPVMSNFREYGFCSAVSKPYRMAELREVLQAVVQKRND